ncbi:MAG: glucuronate isomerase, partial [Bacteroidetes bacterium]
MKAFLDADFLLENETARRLYHDYARDLPIIDYHCHLPPADIAGDRRFANLTRIWLEGDHYKWRAMRARGVPEAYITGEADDYDKFVKWAETVPYTMRNPLYHWTHLELQRYFGIDTLLNGDTAREIYEACTARLQEPGYTTQGLLTRMQVEVVCTTDDPTDDLTHHQQVAASGFSVQMRPTFRPDKALAIENPETYRVYLKKLEAVTGSRLEHFIDLLNALQQRVDFFHAQGCRLSDHGLNTMYARDFTDDEVNFIFQKVCLGHVPTEEEAEKFKSCLLLHLGEMYYEKGWTQ